MSLSATVQSLFPFKPNERLKATHLIENIKIRYLNKNRANRRRIVVAQSPCSHVAISRRKYYFWPKNPCDTRLLCWAIGESDRMNDGERDGWTGRKLIHIKFIFIFIHRAICVECQSNIKFESSLGRVAHSLLLYNCIQWACFPFPLTLNSSMSNIFTHYLNHSYPKHPLSSKDKCQTVICNSRKKKKNNSNQNTWHKISRRWQANAKLNAKYTILIHTFFSSSLQHFYRWILVCAVRVRRTVMLCVQSWH